MTYTDDELRDIATYKVDGVVNAALARDLLSTRAFYQASLAEERRLGAKVGRLRDQRNEYRHAATQAREEAGAEIARLRAEVIELRTARNKDREVVAHYRAAVGAVRDLISYWRDTVEAYRDDDREYDAELLDGRVAQVRAALDEHLGDDK